MKLYLVRHGEALPKDVDPERGLSEPGRKDVERVASFLEKSGVSVSRLVHSGKARARQTAEILAKHVAPSVQMEIGESLNPNDPVESIAYEANGYSEETMLVGHLPFMERLASRLVAGSEDSADFIFQAAAVLCLERGEGGRWSIAWMVSPANF